MPRNNENGHLLIIIKLLSAVMLISGCIPAQPKVSNDLENSFRELVPISDMNKSLRVRVNTEKMKDLHFGSDIRVVITNLSNQPIRFPLDLGFRLFIARNDSWIEIHNQDKYYGDESSHFLRDQGKIGDRISTGIRPVLTSGLDKGHTEILRIVVMGEVIAGGETIGLPVGAFTDAFVNP